MRILFTGASSLAGHRVLECVLESAEDIEVWCARHHGKVSIADSRIRVFDLDLAGAFDEQSLPESIDTVIHFAGVTHAHDAETYWQVNQRGTMRLAESTRARGCRQFVYISTRCATPECGAYGESKLEAETELKKFVWESLLIIRPSEIYGARGNEGLDKLIALARRWHLTPWLFGNSKISFAPLHIDEFAAIVSDEIVYDWSASVPLAKDAKGDLRSAKPWRIVELCGPEDLNATALAARLAKHYRAVPVPVWWPLFALFLRVAAGFNSGLAVPDQLQRLMGAKTSMAKSADRIGNVRFLLD